MIFYVIFLAIFSPTQLFSKLYSRYWYQKILFDWRDDLRITSSQKILEIGCAGGDFTHELSKLSGDITGIDISKGMIERAKKIFPKNNFVLQNGEKLPFETHTFDLILGANILNIVSHKNAFLQEALHVTKDGGKLSFLVPSQNMQAKFSWKIFTHFDDASRFVWFLVARKVSQSEIKNILKNSGYKISFQSYENNMLFAVNITK